MSTNKKSNKRAKAQPPAVSAQSPAVSAQPPAVSAQPPALLPAVSAPVADNTVTVMPALTIVKKEGLDMCVDDNGNVLVEETITHFLENAETYNADYLREFGAGIFNLIPKEAFAKLPAEKVMQWRKILSPFGRTIEGSNCYCNLSITQPAREFDFVLSMLGQQGYIMKALDEYLVPEGVPTYSVADYVDNPSILATPQNMIDKKDSLGIAKYEYARRAMKYKARIYAFLESLFQFNPNEHVMPGYQPNPADSTRKPIRTRAAHRAIEFLKQNDSEFKSMQELQEQYMREQGIDPETGFYTKPRTKKVRRTTRSIIKGRDGQPDKPVEHSEIVEVPIMPVEPSLLSLPFGPKIMDHSFLHVFDDAGNPISENVVAENKTVDKDLRKRLTETLIPLDTLARAKMYIKSNYDELLTLVNDLSGWKPDIQYTVNPYSWHQTEEEAAAFVRKHAKEVIATIYTVQSGKWNILSDYRTVRERIKFYGENTKVIEMMMEKHQKDEKMGDAMLKLRMKKNKKANEIEAGKHADSFKKWKKQSDLVKTVNPGGMADDDIPDDAVSLDIWKCNPSYQQVVRETIAIQSERPTVAEAPDNKQDT